MSKLIGVISRYGKPAVTRQDARDMTVRVSQLDYAGVTIQAELLALGAGGATFEINNGPDVQRVSIGLCKDDGASLEDRVTIQIGGRYLSITEIKALYDVGTGTPAEQCDSWTDYKARRDEWANQVEHNRRMAERS